VHTHTVTKQSKEWGGVASKVPGAGVEGMSLNLTNVQAHRTLTVSLAQWLVVVYDSDDWLDKQELASLYAALAASGFGDVEDDDEGERKGKAKARQLPCASHSVDRKDPRPEADELPPPPPSFVKIFTTWEAIVSLKDKLGPKVLVVDSAKEADFLLLTENVQQFVSIPSHQRVGQFPYEGGFIRKDLLSLTVRGYCFSRPDNIAPTWYLPSYDMSTEFHFFAEDFRRRHKDGLQNDWIVKPAQGSRGMGHRIMQGAPKKEAGMEGTDARDWRLFGEKLLREIALAAPQLPYDADANVAADSTAPSEMNSKIEGMDKVAQLVVTHPLLVRPDIETDRLYKFDLRVCVVVRSFVPLEMYMHSDYYARLANKKYDPAHLQDEEVALTVSAYSQDTERAGRQRRLSRKQLEEALLRENPAMDPQTLGDDIERLVSELFGGIAPSIGHWPRSSAYYAVDIIFDAHGPVRAGQESSHTPPTAKLIEVNFMGDITGYRHTCSSEEVYCSWVSELIRLMATKESPGPKWKRVGFPIHIVNL